MFIGELSKKTGFSRDTIRFYEKLGVIGKKIIQGESKYKIYNDIDLKRLQRIKKIKAFGFTLNEIKDILTAWDCDDINCDEMARRGKKKILEIDRKILEFQKIKESIKHEFTKCAKLCVEDKCGILEV